jgi:hypothetical protein
MSLRVGLVLNAAIEGDDSERKALNTNPYSSAKTVTPAMLWTPSRAHMIVPEMTPQGIITGNVKSRGRGRTTVAPFSGPYRSAKKLGMIRPNIAPMLRMGI